MTQSTGKSKKSDFLVIMERTIVLMPLRRTSPRGGGTKQSAEGSSSLDTPGPSPISFTTLQYFNTDEIIASVISPQSDTVFLGPDYQSRRWIITGTSDGSLERRRRSAANTVSL